MRRGRETDSDSDSDPNPNADPTDHTKKTLNTNPDTEDRLHESPKKERRKKKIHA